MSTSKKSKLQTVIRTVEIRPLLALWQVLGIVPISKTTWYEGIRNGRYPRPVQISARRVGWRLADIEKWMADRTVVHAKDKGAA